MSFTGYDYECAPCGVWWRGEYEQYPECPRCGDAPTGTNPAQGSRALKGVALKRNPDGTVDRDQALAILGQVMVELGFVVQGSRTVVGDE